MTAAGDELFATRRRSAAAAVLAVVGGWTVFGVLASLHFFWAAEPGRRAASFAELASHVVVFYWGWALLTPAVLALARRAAAQGTTARRWGVLLLGGAVVVVAHALVYFVSVRVFGLRPDVAVTGGQLRAALLRHGGGDAATYLVLVGAYLLHDASRRAGARDVAVAALEARLARADLEILQWQLQPHFLMNALNTVSTLVLRADLPGAERAIGLIARYLRSALARRGDVAVPLAQELRFVERYVEIEALRFGDALRPECAAAPDALARSLPVMILQPVVENAIRHGLAARAAPPVVTIAASLDGDRLVVTVRGRGDGPTLALGAGALGTADRAGAGFGLAYVGEPLRHHYGDAARFDLRAEAGGTVATLDVPSRPETSQAAA